MQLNFGEKNPADSGLKECCLIGQMKKSYNSYPLVWGIKWLLWVPSMLYILPLQLPQWYQYHVMTGHVITRA